MFLDEYKFDSFPSRGLHFLARIPFHVREQSVESNQFKERKGEKRNMRQSPSSGEEKNSRGIMKLLSQGSLSLSSVMPLKTQLSPCCTAADSFLREGRRGGRPPASRSSLQNQRRFLWRVWEESAPDKAAFIDWVVKAELVLSVLVARPICGCTTRQQGATALARTKVECRRGKKTKWHLPYADVTGNIDLCRCRTWRTCSGKLSACYTVYWGQLFWWDE